MNERVCQLFVVFQHEFANLSLPCEGRFKLPVRDLAQNTTATAARTSPNKRFNEQNNSCARALKFLVHSFAVLCKTTTWNDQILCCLENVNHNG